MSRKLEDRSGRAKELMKLVESMEDQYPGVHELEQTYALIRRQTHAPQQLSRVQFTQSSTVSNTTS